VSIVRGGSRRYYRGMPDEPGMPGPHRVSGLGQDGDSDDRPLGPPVYSLGTSPSERERLRRQSLELHQHSAALLDHVGVAHGWSAIDLGCGPSGILALLSERVGPDGDVTGLEVHPESAASARVFAAEHGLANVEVIEGDARRTGLPSSSFDVVHARTLLINVPEPAMVVAEMARLARPGGWVVLTEPDVTLSLCYPPHPAWDRLIEVLVASKRADDTDALVGRRLPELLRGAGLTDIGVEAKADIYPPGHSRRSIRLDLVRSMRPRILERGIASEQELDELDRAAQRHLDDPRTLVLPHLLFLAWGRKPARDSGNPAAQPATPR
jgi:SAM-dependent methyltransferase